jgi:hypothetical protein
MTMQNLAVIAALATVALLSASPARADLVLKLTDGVNTVQITDQVVAPVLPNTNPDGNATLGVVNFSGAVGSWVVNVSTGLGSPFFQEGHLDLNSVNVLVAGSGTLDILLTQTGLTQPLNTFSMNFGETLSGSAGSTVKFDAWRDGTNTPFGLGAANLIGTLGPFGLGANSGSVTGFVAGGTPYSLTERIRIVATGPVSFSGDAELISAVPEPATLTLLGTGLIGIARAFRRRAQKGAMLG